MRRQFLHRCWLMLCLATLGITASAADPGVIYLVDWNKSISGFPLQSNENEFSKLQETEAGSRIYVGNHEFSSKGGCFRFFSALQEGPNVNWKINNICPMKDGVLVTEVGKSGVLTSNDVYDIKMLSPYEEPGVWLTTDSGEYKVTVDLNAGTLELIPVSDYLVLINNDRRPDTKNLADCLSFNSLMEYVPEGDFKLYFYSLYNNGWLEPTRPSLKVGNNVVNGSIVATPQAFEAKEWVGGTISKKFSNLLCLNANSYVTDYTDALFISTPDDKLELWKGAPNTVTDGFIRLDKIDDNQWETTLTIPSDDYRFNIICSLTEKGTPNQKLAPSVGKEVTLAFNGCFAYSSATQQSDVQAPFWRIKRAAGKEMTLTITRDDSKYILKLEDKQAGDPVIYLIGTPNGWNINNDSMPLTLTDKGGYYGCFNLPEGENYFRFYTSLGDWGGDYSLPSIGSGPVDGENVEISLYDTYRGYCSEGKGSWVIYATGEPVYMYVDISTHQVIFSLNPIAEAGNYVTIDREPVKDGMFVSIDGEDRIEFDKLSDGVYALAPVDMHRGTHELRFFNKVLPISRDEAEWIGSYTVSFKNGSIADLTAKHYAEFDLSLNNAISTVPATPLTLTLGQETGSHTVSIVVDLNKNKMYVADFERYVALDYNDEDPTALTFDKVSDRLITSWGSILNIPAGKFDLRFFNNYLANRIPSKEVKFDFNENPFIVETDFSNVWVDKRVIAPEWKGGPVYLSENIALDMNKITTIYAHNLTETVEMKQTAPGSMIYKGVIDMTPVENASPVLGFVLYQQEVNMGSFNSVYSVYFGSPCLSTGTGDFGIDDLRNLAIVDKKAESKVYFGGTPFTLTNLKEAGKFDITVNLNTMEMTATLVEGSVSTRFETVESTESPLDGAESYTISSINYIEVDDLPAKEGTYGFNLMTDRNTTIVPASGANTVLEFDATGTWTGEYKEVPSVAAQQAPAASRRGVLRQASSQQAQWSFNIPRGDFTNLAMAIDESNKTITIHSFAHNKGFFIVQNDNLPRVDKIKDAAKHMLLPGEDPEVLEGTFFVTGSATDYRVLQFVSGPRTAYSPLYGVFGDQESLRFDVTAGKSTLPVWDNYKWNGNTYYIYANWFNFAGESGKYKAVYNRREHTLNISGYSGIDNVIEDGRADDGIRIVPGNGCATIMAEKPVRVDFYAVNGTLVKSVDATAGSTIVTLAPGFYIASGNKIAVK